MFAGFNLEISKSFFDSQVETFQKFQEIGEKHLKSQTCGVEKALDTYINNNIVDGSKIQKDWFPEIDTDIFLSHSSIDNKLVNAIAGWINCTFGLRCFIDSDVWCYAGSIADKLNDRFSNKRVGDAGGLLYSHENCLKVSEHVNTMLNIALQRMIDKCESVFLVNTENSIHINSSPNSIDVTYSPWIYSELVCSEIIRRKSLYSYRYNVRLEHSFTESEDISDIDEKLTISYNVPVKHLIKIGKGELERWKNRYDDKYPFPLDLLYIDYFHEEVEKVRKHFKY